MRPAHKPWLSAEARVADRFVRALVAGRYASAAETVPHCQRALDQLRVRALKRGKSLPLRSSGAVRCRINKQARSVGRPTRPAHKPWLPAEARVADRFVRTLLAGRYASAREAVPDCQQALERLRARSPRDGKNLPPRSHRAVWYRISELARDTGRPLRRVRYTREEKQLFNRYARQLASGRYATLADAARACWTAHARLRERRSPPPPARPLHGIYQALDVTSRKLGRKPAPHPQWTLDSERILRRYVAAVAAGRYPNAAAAVPDCRRELPQPHSTDSTSRRLRRLAGEWGWSAPSNRWSFAESRIAEPFAMAVVRGEYPGVSSAVGDCLAALKAAGLHDRSGSDVRYRLRRRARRLGLKPMYIRWNASELEVIDRFARRLAEDRHRSVDAAVGQCRKALADAGFASRTAWSIRHKLQIAARARGRGGWPLWSEAENKACDSWIDWYDRHRRIRRYRAITVAIDGLLEDVQNLGSERTRIACAAHFRIRRMQLNGIADLRIRRTSVIPGRGKGIALPQAASEQLER